MKSPQTGRFLYTAINLVCQVLSGRQLSAGLGTECTQIVSQHLWTKNSCWKVFTTITHEMAPLTSFHHQCRPAYNSSSIRPFIQDSALESSPATFHTYWQYCWHPCGRWTPKHSCPWQQLWCENFLLTSQVPMKIVHSDGWYRHTWSTWSTWSYFKYLCWWQLLTRRNTGNVWFSTNKNSQVPRGWDQARNGKWPTNTSNDQQQS